MFKSKAFETLSQVSSAIRSVPWARADQDALIGKVAEKTTQTSDSSVGRPKLQNFTTIQHFLTAEVWARLLSDKMSASSKMETLLTEMVSLALRHPSEGTFQVMAGLYLATSEGLSGGMKVAAHLKYSVLQSIKKGWRAMAKPTPPTFVAELPATPDLFRKSFPGLYTEAFGEGAPAPCPLDQMHLAALVASVPMRSRSKMLGASVVPLVGFQPPQQQDQLAQALLQAFIANFSADSSRQAQPVLKIFPQKALPAPSMPQRPTTSICGRIANEAQSLHMRQKVVEEEVEEPLCEEEEEEEEKEEQADTRYSPPAHPHIDICVPSLPESDAPTAKEKNLDCVRHAPRLTGGAWACLQHAFVSRSRALMKLCVCWRRSASLSPDPVVAHATRKNVLSRFRRASCRPANSSPSRRRRRR